ncbi:STAS domain-containing protein [Streptomyces sp. NPDC005244]|uniref:STAS domain-containing protein n=1 Tax=Streptomyces sp. NPDC005244 TaxID=3364708 RepID=UPI0036C2966E
MLSPASARANVVSTGPPSHGSLVVPPASSLIASPLARAPAHRPETVGRSAVTFMDSTGIRALVATYRSVQSTRGWIRIAAANEAVLRVVQIAGVDTIIGCYPTLVEALNP